MLVMEVAALLLCVSVSHSLQDADEMEDSESWIYSQDFIAIIGNYVCLIVLSCYKYFECCGLCK